MSITTSTPQTSTAASWSADLSLLGVALIWGINIPIMKVGLEQVDIFVFSGVRLTISALVLGALAWRDRPRTREHSGKSVPLRKIVPYAVMVSACYQLLFLVGVSWTTAGNTALIIATVPIWTALLAQLCLGERLTALSWYGLAIGLVGTVIVAWQKGDVSSGSAYRLGNLLILGAAIIWAGGTVYSRPLLQHIRPMQLAATASLIGLPFHLVLALSRGPAATAPLANLSLWWVILYSGVLSSGLAQPMWHFGVRHAGAAHAAVMQNLIPLVAIVAAWLLRGVAPTSPQVIGGALILGGLVLMRRGRA